MTGTFDAVLAVAVILALLAAVAIGLQFLQRKRLTHELRSLTTDMNLAEKVAGIGYWSRAVGTDRAEWSAGMYEIFEQDPEKFTPTVASISALFFPADWEKINKLREVTAASRRGGEVEARIRCPSGQVKNVLVATRFRIGKADTIVGIFGITADITGRKTAERAAQEREEQLQRAVSAMGAAIWDWDIGTDRMFAGPRFAEILGLDPQSFNPTMALHHQLCHPDDLSIVQNAFRASIKTGDPYSIEYRMRHSDGHYVWVLSRGRIVTYDGDRPVRAIGTVVDITESQKDKEDLRRSRESLELAMAASQAGHFDLNPETNEAYWSPRALEIMGLADSDYRPNSVTLGNLVHSDDLPEFLASREEFMLRDVPLDAQVRVKHGRGHYVWVHIRAVHLRKPTGESHRIIGLIRDVSASVLAQQALADSERKFRDLIEGSLQGVLILSKRKPVFCNQALAKIMGYDRADELLALESLDEHIPAERLSEVQGNWDRALRREFEGQARRRRILGRGGRTRWIEVVERLIQWEGGPARQLVVLDVTEQEAFQAKLRASEERFRLLADNISDIITLYDQDLVLRYVSPSIERVAGYKPEEVIGRDMFYITMPEDRPPPEIQRMMREKPMYGSHVWRLQRKDGTALWVESTSSPIPALQGQKGGYAMVSALRDVTERVEREAELSGARDRLKNQADELTILAQNLEMERERAEQANSAKSQFLAMMSHELRTPMTGVLGMSDLLLMSQLTAEQEDLTNLLKRSACTLLDLLNDILDFSKIEAGQLEIESTPFELSEVLHDVINLFSTTASTKGVVLNSRAPAAFWNVVNGDPKRLRQVLSNLVGNAIKFTEAGSVTIALEELAGPGETAMLKFDVVDTGIGISAADASKLFKPFVQADVSTSRKYGGTGLGLAISKRLVEGMGGALTIASEPGKGSTFSFTVQVVPDRSKPRVNGLAAEKASAVQPERAEAKAAARKILLAEDNETSRYLISTMLTRFGHTVDVAENGAEAVAAVRAKDYDIVLMDMQMPVMDGPDATREIRRMKGPRAKLPVIALTADVIASHRSTYFAAGVNAIVGKPVNWAELSQEMERQLAGRGAAPAKAAEEARAENGEAVLDEKALGALEEALGVETLAPMLKTFSANMEKYRTDLAAAVSAGDLKQARRTAHALKGLCAQFGAMQASALARFVETEAKGLGDIQPMLGRIDHAINATQSALAARGQRVPA